MQKRNVSTERAQRVNKKNEVTCLVIIFNPGVMVIKMSIMAHFLIKISHSLGKIFYRI